VYRNSKHLVFYKDFLYFIDQLNDMYSKPTDHSKPSFNSLTEIISHFHNVPFNDFKNDLDKWFDDQMESNGELSANDIAFCEQIKLLASTLYAKAEIIEGQSAH
jgi:hypothetical protein